MQLLSILRERYNSESERFPIIRPKTERALLEVVKNGQPKTILELGTGVGYSALVMLDAAKEATMVTVERDKENYERAICNFFDGEVNDRILPVNADAVDVVNSLANHGGQKFDLIFLDCNKSSYVEMASNLTQLLESGGVLFADNVLFLGLVQGDRNIPLPHKHRTIVTNLRKFIDFCSECGEFSSVQVVDSEDGFLIAVKK